MSHVSLTGGDEPSVKAQLDTTALSLESRFSAAAAMLSDAKEDLCAFASFPQTHWTKIWSNNPLERVNAEIKRRTRVVGIFPNDAAVLRLVTAVCVEQHDEWIASERRYLSEQSMALLRDDHADDELCGGAQALMS